MISYNRLATIQFEDPDILQRKIDTGYTAYRHVIYGEVAEDDSMLSLWIVRENIGLLVAIQYLSEREGGLELSKSYEEFTCERKLTKQDISDIFARIFDKPSLIEPMETTPVGNPKNELQSAGNN
jgi:hypothetical protein